MLKTHLFLVIAVSLGACEGSPDSSDTEHVEGELEGADATGVRMQGSGSLTCDCAQLIPIKFRPDFPRVSNPGQTGCRYYSADMESRELIVGLEIEREADHFEKTKANLQNKYVKLYETTNRPLDDSGQASVTVAADDNGLTRFTILHHKLQGVITTLLEPLNEPASAPPAPGFPRYIEGLTAGLSGSCSGT